MSRRERLTRLQKAAAAEKPRAVRVGPARMGKIVRTVEASGKLAARE